jgi:hypothetical protein
MTRIDHWQTLLRARAIENQVYVVAANGCGLTGAMEMAGHSMLIGPDGTVLQAAGTEATVIGCNLDAALVDQQRSRFFPAGRRAAGTGWAQARRRETNSIGQTWGNARQPQAREKRATVNGKHAFMRVIFQAGPPDVINKMPAREPPRAGGP